MLQTDSANKGGVADSFVCLRKGAELSGTWSVCSPKSHRCRSSMSVDRGGVEKVERCSGGGKSPGRIITWWSWSILRKIN